MSRQIFLRSSDGELKGRLSPKMLDLLITGGYVDKVGTTTTGRTTYNLTQDGELGESVTVNGRELDGVKPLFTLLIWKTDYIVIMEGSIKP